MSNLWSGLMSVMSVYQSLMISRLRSSLGFVMGQRIRPLKSSISPDIRSRYGSDVDRMLWFDVYSQIETEIISELSWPSNETTVRSRVQAQFIHTISYHIIFQIETTVKGISQR